jgi:Rho-binding antiterminator
MSEDHPAGYRPIACSVHDRLEALATLRARVTIRYLDEAGAAAEVRGRIADLYARGGAEFLRTDAGVEIRLDRIMGLVEGDGG